MENLGGLDNELMTAEQGNGGNSAEESKQKRRPFFFWEVNGTTHKMKLQTGMISKLENKYRRNILNIVSDDGIPPLSVMLTIAQAALVPWEHGISYQSVEKLYESWLEHDDGSQAEFLSKVIIPTMAVSGFFTPAQAESIMKSLEEATELI